MYLLEKKMTDLQNQGNLLSQYYRQPKIYIRLPSNGEFYPEGTLDQSENGEYAVYGMTAKDELMFKTPDALLSGQSTVEVIKSCVPAIKDPWQMPTLDVDTVLVAIRIATFGGMMEMSSTCTECTESNDYELDLTNLLSSLGNIEYDSVIDVDPLKVHIRPYTYREMTKTALKTFEQQRIFQIINDDSMSDEQKVEMFGQSFVKITELSVDIIAGCIYAIETPQGTVQDQAQIKEFINNTTKDTFDTISDHIQTMKGRNEIKPVDVTCAGCGHEYQQPFSMDQANFFDR